MDVNPLAWQLELKCEGLPTRKLCNPTLRMCSLTVAPPTPHLMHTHLCAPAAPTPVSSRAPSHPPKPMPYITKHLQAVLLVGFMAEEVERFRKFMIDMEADMVKVCVCVGSVDGGVLTETQRIGMISCRCVGCGRHHAPPSPPRQSFLHALTPTLVSTSALLVTSLGPADCPRLPSHDGGNPGQRTGGRLPTV